MFKGNYFWTLQCIDFHQIYKLYFKLNLEKTFIKLNKSAFKMGFE